MSRTATRERPAYRCAECGWHQPSGSAGAASARPGARSRTLRPRSCARPRPARSARPPGRSARSTSRRLGRPDRGRRARPGARRRAGAGCRRAARRRAGGRQVDAAARRRGSVRRARPRALRHRRGVSRPGAAAGRPHRGAARRPLPRRRDRPGRGARPRRRRAPDLLVVDSVQTIASAEVDGSPGNVSQVREVAAALIRVAKERGIATVLVGHVTKDGSIAGPRVLEHLVDVVLHFEGDRHSRLRMVRGIKNRYGPSDEVGCFDLSDEGIDGLPDPSGLFLSRRHEAVPGTCVTVTVEGKRPLVAEVQALVAADAPRAPAADHERPRRRPGGDGARRPGAPGRGTIRMSATASDVYAATVGGVRLTEPATDLALALAVAGAAQNEPLATGLVAIGEVGLAGEIRRVTGTARRLAEAARLGFTHALVPPDPGRVPAGHRGDRGDRPRARAAGGLPGCRGHPVREPSAASSPALAEACPSRDHPTARGDRPPGRLARVRPTRPAPAGQSGRDDRERELAGTERIDDPLRATLAAVAPGTALRDGLERILRGRTGALIVLGYDKVVEQLCTGGFVLDVEFTATRLRELAKMDGAIVVDRDCTRIVRAAVQLVPDPAIPTDESGTRHRTAERVAKQTGLPVISVSQSMSIIALYVDGPRYVLEDSDPDPVPGQPGAGHARALQAAPRRGVRHAVRAGDRGPGHRARRLRGGAAAGDGAPHRRRDRGVRRRARHRRPPARPAAGRADRRRRRRTASWSPATTCRADRAQVTLGRRRAGRARPARLPSCSTWPRSPARSATRGGEALDAAVSPRGYRLLARVPRLPGHRRRPAGRPLRQPAEAARRQHRRPAGGRRASASRAPAASARACPGWPSPRILERYV